MTHEGHRSASAHSLKQLIKETLRSGMEYTNAADLRQVATTTGQCSNNMNCTPEPDDQGVKIIPRGLTYWQNWEDEVCYNSGRSHARETSPQHPDGTNNQFPCQLSIPEQENDHRSHLSSIMASMLSTIARIPWQKIKKRASPLTSQLRLEDSLVSQMPPQTPPTVWLGMRTIRIFQPKNTSSQR